MLRDGSKLDGVGLRDRSAHDNARISMLLQLGSLYAEQGKLQRALAVYRETLHSLPKNYPPQVSAAIERTISKSNCQRRRGERFEPDICWSMQGVYHRLGDTLARLHQWPEAERFHQAALEAQPDHVATHVSYGTMLARNVRIELPVELRSSTKNRFAFLSRSRFSHLQNSRTSEAELWFKRAIKLAPNDSSVRHHYGKRSSITDNFPAFSSFSALEN